jgi:hypothetical protein
MAIDVSFLRGLDQSAVTRPPAQFTKLQSVYASFPHRATKIKTPWLSRETFNESAFGTASLLQSGDQPCASREIFVWILRVRNNTRWPGAHRPSRQLNAASNAELPFARMAARLRNQEGGLGIAERIGGSRAAEEGNVNGTFPAKRGETRGQVGA